ncbi:MAG: GGDEF domain-containing protein [Aquabacterium sp.]|nr:GGDEF domain-containing protein [Aquabacterium sp.]
MLTVVDHLATLTAFRDRDVVDASLATALRDLLQSGGVAVYRCVGEAGDRRWLTRARLAAHDTVPSADPLWTDLADLAPLAAHPHRLAALQQQAAVSVSGDLQTTVFPLTGDHDDLAVLELQTDAPLAPVLQRQVVSILRVYRNFRALLDDSERDTLTGLLNRKTFDEAFYKIAEAGVRPLLSRPGPAVQADERRDQPQAEQPHFIAVIDIDHFKLVNDNHGHLIGDEVLLLLSRLMRSVFRFHDRLYRFGGEEFVVLMRCSGDKQAGQALERLRTCVRSFAFPKVGTISVSAGYTQLRPGDTPGTAFDRADRAVYWAKGHGRDQVCSHAGLVARGDLQDDLKLADGAGDVELF